MGFDFDEATRRQLGYELIDLINSYYSSLPTRRVQLPADQRTFGQLTERMPDESGDPHGSADLSHILQARGAGADAMAAEAGERV